MLQSLVVAVRFHEGRYHGENDRFDGVDGWPPSPGRVFQAMVAAAARGASIRAEDREALTWLECIDPPRIAAPPARRGQSVKLFVPNNDLDSVGGDPQRASKIRDAKQWRPWFFDHIHPVLYCWDFGSGLRQAERICAIAARLYQLGRGIDMAWSSGHVLARDDADALLGSHPGPIRRPTGVGATATPCHGTFASLAKRYEKNRTRFTQISINGKPRQQFTAPPNPSFARTGYDSPPRYLHFEIRTSKGSFAPQPLSAAASLLTGLRDRAAWRLREKLPERGAEFERLVVGRGAGPMDLARRVRLMPVPSIGHLESDLLIRRLTIKVPAACPIGAEDLEWAFAGLRPLDANTGEALPGILQSKGDSDMADRFLGSALAFRSVTPVALSGCARIQRGAVGTKTADQRIREEKRAAGGIVQALRHAGVQAKPTDIRVQREPFQRRGARAEAFAVGSRFSKHALWHVQIHFRESVRSPVLIGDGRFCGLGLLKPVVSRSEYSDVFVFAIRDVHRIASEHRPQLLRSLRRALMSLARDEAGKVDRLFSGHEPSGAIDRAGHHAHVFLAADGGAGDDRAIARLIVIAPWAVDRKAKPAPGDRQRFEEVTRTLRDLRAGRLGRFDRLVAQPIGQDDPLIGPARTWVSDTPYVATRNLKRRDNAGATVIRDLMAECHRRGLPAPAHVDVSDVTAGPRGGRPTAMLTLRFATAVRGPVFLGRDSHVGGGVFRTEGQRD